MVFEPLVGELFRSQLVQQAAPRNGDFVTPTIVGAEEYDFAERDLRYTTAMFELLTHDREFADHNQDDHAGVAVGLGAAVPSPPPARCSRSGRSPTRSHRVSRTAWTRPRTGSAGILSDLRLEAPKELAQ